MSGINRHTSRRRLTLTRSFTSRIVIVAAFAGACASITAQSSRIQIIPAPKSVETGSGTFQIDRRTRVVLADSKSAGNRFAAQDFIDDLNATAEVPVVIGKGRSRSILIGELDTPAIGQLIKQNGMTVPTDLSGEGYVLIATADRVIVAGKTETGTFYGVQTLKQIVRGEGAGAFIPAMKIVDWPTMRWRGVSDDISRGPVPTVNYIKRQIRTEAFFKLNMHSFYMEHTFASESHPLIGPEGGSLTAAEIKELVAYARDYHVQLVPEQQTFGHLHKALRLEKDAELAETPYGDVLSPQQPGTYKLIADWYKELNELFPGQL